MTASANYYIIQIICFFKPGEHGFGNSKLFLNFNYNFSKIRTCEEGA